MSDTGLTTSQISAAGAYAQAERMAVTIPVRAIDPTRQRFQVEDQTAPQEAPSKAQPEADAADGDGSAATGQQQAATGERRGFGLIGAFTSFLARMFGQTDAAQGGAAAASAKSAAQAYSRTASTAGVIDNGPAEVLSPAFPRLASGRTIDLTV